MRRFCPYLPSLLALAAVLAAWLLLRPGPQPEGRREPPPALDFTAERQALSESVAEYRPDPGASVRDLSLGCEFVGGLPGASWLHVVQAQVGDGPTARVVHVADYHWVPPDLYDGALPYGDFLDRVELVQEQQGAMLAVLVKYHGLTEVWQEGLTEAGLGEYRATVEGLRKLWNQRERLAALHGQVRPEEPKAARALQDVADLERELQAVWDAQRPLRLQLGAPALLLARGELGEVLPLDDEVLWGKSKALDPHDVEAREDYMVRAVLKRGGVAVLVLGGGHDLADNIARLAPGCEYARVEPQGYRLVTGENP